MIIEYCDLCGERIKRLGDKVTLQLIAYKEKAGEDEIQQVPKRPPDDLCIFCYEKIVNFLATARRSDE